MGDQIIKISINWIINFQKTGMYLPNNTSLCKGYSFNNHRNMYVHIKTCYCSEDIELQPKLQTNVNLHIITPHK